MTTYSTTFDSLQPQKRELVRDQDKAFDVNSKSSAIDIHRWKAIQKLKNREVPNALHGASRPEIQSALSFFKGPFDAFSFTEHTLKDIDVMGPRRPLWLLDIQEKNSSVFYIALRVCLQFHFAYQNEEKVWVGPLQVILRGDVSPVSLAILDEFGLAPDEIHFSYQPALQQPLLDFVAERPNVLRNVTIFQCDGVPGADAAQDLKLFVANLTKQNPDLVEQQHFLVSKQRQSSYRWLLATNMAIRGKTAYKLAWR